MAGRNNPSYDALRREIETLPKGSIAIKHVKGKPYHYHRWYEDGRRHERYVAEADVPYLVEGIERRKALEAQLKADGKKGPSGYRFHASVLTGDELEAFSAPVRSFRKRECFDVLRDYAYGESDGRVLILFGLRRTGKTTLIRQLISEMSDEVRSHAAFMQVGPDDTLADINRDLRLLMQQGYSHVFIDEVTLLPDFIDGSALFADIFASSGMKIVLSGTDSLGFVLSEDEQLYDRCLMIHTTFIPYREFSYVLGVKGIDEYIRFGGTMSLSGRHYNGAAMFSDARRVDEYIDTAIARNIQHSLRYYQDGRHFRLLHELYQKDELTGAINRVVEDMNHRFTLDVLIRSFRSGDLALSARNLRHDRSHPTSILDDVDIKAITDRLRRRLEILEMGEMSVSLSQAHADEIREYLELMDLIMEIPVMDISSSTAVHMRTVITQPGLRYAQADALVESLIEDETMDDLPVWERAYVLERIRSEIRGRMMEDIVLLETTLAFPDKRVFVLQFPVGEFDMVIFDPVSLSCCLYEIKHSDAISEEQQRHLRDEEKLKAVRFRFGTIRGRYVLYRGKDASVDGIEYRNVEEYLESL